MKKVLASMLVFAASTLGASGATSNLNDGIALLNSGRYKESQEALSRAVKERPNQAMPHYYLAGALMHLRLYDQAKQEYFACYCLSPNTEIGRYSRNAMSILDVVAQPDTKKPEDKNVTRSVSHMHEEAVREKSRQEKVGGGLATNAGSNAATEEARIKENFEQFEGKAPYVMLGERGQHHDDYSSHARESIMLTRDFAREKADRYRAYSQLQESKIDEVAANLESQLKLGTANDTSRLHAEGTGLFVRYYGTPQGEAEVPETHASVIRILPKGGDVVQENLPKDFNKSVEPVKSVKATLADH